MDQATYSIEHAKTGRSKCKQCKVEIDKDQLRIGKHFPSERFEEGGSATEWRHPACLFQHLKRVKKTTKKVETEADLSGFVLLDDSEKAEIRALIAQKDVPSPKKPKAKKAPVAKSSPLGTPAVAAPVDVFVCILEPATAESGLKQLELTNGVHVLGRGPSIGIDVKAISRQQVEIHVKADDQSVIFVRKGSNVSRLLRVDRDPVDTVVDQLYLLSDGDQFGLLGSEYVYTVKFVVKSTPAVAASVASMPVALPPIGSAPVEGGKELPAWMKGSAATPAAASAPPTTSATSSAAPPPKAKASAKPKAAKAKTTSLEPAKQKTKTKKKKDDEEEDENEPNSYDLEDSFIDADVPDEAVGADVDSDDDDSNVEPKGGNGKKRAIESISKAANDSDDGDDENEDLGELAREARAFVKSGGITTSLPPCRYGAKCYRTNAEHLADFSHPPREADMGVLAVNAATLVQEMPLDVRIDALVKVYPHVDREVIRDVLAANSNLAFNATDQLAELEVNAISAE